MQTVDAEMVVMQNEAASRANVAQVKTSDTRFELLCTS